MVRVCQPKARYFSISRVSQKTGLTLDGRKEEIENYENSDKFLVITTRVTHHATLFDSILGHI